jgi:hypothetical protein
MKTSDAQRKANKKYKAKHPAKQRLYNYRSSARTFIKDYAELKDLDELTALIHAKRREIEEGANDEKQNTSK